MNDSLHFYEKVEYLIDISVGSEGQIFSVVVDTGSSDLWIPSVGAKGF